MVLYGFDEALKAISEQQNYVIRFYIFYNCVTRPQSIPGKQQIFYKSVHKEEKKEQREKRKRGRKERTEGAKKNERMKK